MKRIINYLLLCLCIVSCSENPEIVQKPNDDFNRSVMLSDWANGIIIPHYQNYKLSLDELKSSASLFIELKNEDTFDKLRNSWLDAYIEWQYVSMFEIGMAESIGLRNFTNIYPCNTEEIEANIEGGLYNLKLPSTFDEQGFPAIEYLLFGIESDVQGIVSKFQLKPAYGEYLVTLINRLRDLTTEVLADWQQNYASAFISNSASSATGSVDKLVNDYVFYYEKFFRAGKFGIPAGVFSGKVEAHTIEGLYSEEYSKILALNALNAIQNFFNGRSHLDNSYSGESISSYLDYLNSIKSGSDLSALINQQFESARLEIEDLEDNFYEQLIRDNIAMLEAYDEIQKNVVLLKVDLMQALNVRVDYVDADGD